MNERIKLNTIDEAVDDFREGKFVIVVDDEDRENEGDLICAAEKITPEMVNFMLKYARGVLCAPITISRSEELDLPHQVQDNTSVLGTPFTVTVDKLEGPPVSRPTTVPPPSVRWPTRHPHLRPLAVQVTLTLSMPRTTACCAALVIRKQPSTSVNWRDFIRPAH